MVSGINAWQAHVADPFGTAPASPQSARGESANADQQAREASAASQANSPIYDQRSALEDRTVAARTAAVELAARGGLATAEKLDPHPGQDATPATLPASAAEPGLASRPVEQPGTARQARDQARDQEDTAGRDASTGRALAAYADAGRASAPSAGLSRAI
jgi:hypothetical protein